MKTIKTTTSLLLAILAGLFPGIAAAGPEPAGAVAKDANVALARLACEKQAAAIRLDSKVGSNQGQASSGVFISKEGLSLINLSSLVWKEKPTAVTADGTPLKLGKILGLFPTADLALMKFEHRPKTWVEFAGKDLEVGDAVAVIVVDSQKKTIQDGKVPPVIGKILAKRSCARGDYRKKEFTQILSLGSGLTLKQRLHLAGGPFVINKDGHLVAFFYSQTMRKEQVLLALTPVVTLADSISHMVKEDKAIPFPLSEANNPMDPVLMDPAFNRMAVSRRMGNREESRRCLKELLARYPASFLLKDWALDTVNYYDPADPLVGLEDFPVCDPADPVPDQVKSLDCRAFLLIEMGLTEKAIEARKSAIALSPKDEPVTRHFLARAYFNLGRFEEAESLMREAYPSYWDSIEFAGDYERILIKLGKFEEADKMSDRIYELSEIYRR
ncbi:MAG: tetratricopeptide repeat protein [Akkermansiaceae bacterium]|nr:tetratricopeptide repeat protein [Akkermansiaceae bacterium]MCF7730215.1 tetratricopeptide repeat protein [Akkermansiaceae bacterium]